MCDGLDAVGDDRLRRHRFGRTVGGARRGFCLKRLVANLDAILDHGVGLVCFARLLELGQLRDLLAYRFDAARMRRTWWGE